MPSHPPQPPAQTSTPDPAVPNDPALNPPGFIFRQIDVYDAGPGGKRPYALYIPPSYDPSKPCPAILFLHGSGESGTDGHKQVAQGIGPAIVQDPAKWPFIVIFPQKPDSRSQWLDHQKTVMDILRKTQSEYNIDPDRIYLTGLSQGGAGTWALGSLYPGTFAALVPICGYFRDMGDTMMPQSIAVRVFRDPIWAFHGIKDDVVPYDQTTQVVQAIQERQAGMRDLVPIKLTLLPDANHNSWDAAYRNYDLGNWFLQYRRRAD
ncbi:MAG: dienelactone hydrolase family protein [Planctomycetes bacterium]|nr:dienelactone hydrolase family protein [Planctomycetota bacterium]